MTSVWARFIVFSLMFHIITCAVNVSTGQFIIDLFGNPVKDIKETYENLKKNILLQDEEDITTVKASMIEVPLNTERCTGNTVKDINGVCRQPCANGHLKDLFDGVHNKLHKAREDIHNIIFPTEKEPNINYNERNEQNSSVPSKSDIHVNQEEEQVEAATQTSNTEKIVTVISSTETTSTTEKGRENFTGNCLPGYIRTPDGRCKPSF
ncbi:unnamed protein product [Arctia plantaginis]|uniref:Uncharacterized protein n=1 Tax=Arctia plantaginis TaxID=874455 RepID=A0A8S0ZPF9_ARCPL|nr:unnamed protein product [Arctia plantaginis]